MKGRGARKNDRATRKSHPATFLDGVCGSLGDIYAFLDDFYGLLSDVYEWIRDFERALSPSNAITGDCPG